MKFVFGCFLSRRHVPSLLLVLVLLLGGGLSQVNGTETGPYVSLLWPGIGVGWAGEKWRGEARAQWVNGNSEEGRTGYVGFRANRRFRLKPKLRWYVGTEGGVFQHEDDSNFQTDGLVFGGYLGVEKFFGKRFSFTFDIGPYWAETESQQDITGSEVDAVANAALSWWWGGSK